MILSKSVEIKISNNQIKYYTEKGYKIKGGNEIKEIKISDLPQNSGQKISVRCDFCNNEKVITLNRYNINTKNGTIKYACSRKCAEQKNKDTLQIKYRVSNISYSKEIQQKKENTCNQNHGVSYPMMKEDIFLKGLETKKEKYGDQNYNNSGQMISTKHKKIIKKYNALSYSDNRFEFYCDKCNTNYFIQYGLLLNRIRIKTEMCTKCNPFSSNISGKEKLLLDFIRDNYDGKIITSDRKILNGKELDIYLPDLNLAFEFNGLYWHNELYKDKNYHINKTNLCEKKEIHLVHVWEDDWFLKQDIVKSMILNKIKKTKEKIFGRKTQIIELNDKKYNKQIRSFLNENHLQGFVGSKIKIGLFYDNELVSLMTFGKKRLFMKSKSKSDREYELLRFCNKLNTNVIGAASKLFNFFIKTYKPEEVITYADRSHSQGNLYETLGFEFIHKTQPNYYYIKNHIRNYRYGFRKDVLVSQGYDKNMTEHEIMLSRNIYRIFDSGNLKYIFNMQ